MLIQVRYSRYTTRITCLPGYYYIQDSKPTCASHPRAELPKSSTPTWPSFLPFPNGRNDGHSGWHSAWMGNTLSSHVCFCQSPTHCVLFDGFFYSNHPLHLSTHSLCMILQVSALHHLLRLFSAPHYEIRSLKHLSLRRASPSRRGLYASIITLDCSSSLSALPSIPLPLASPTPTLLPCKPYSLFPVDISRAPLVQVSPALGITYSLLISSVSCESKIRYLLTPSTSINSLPTGWLTLSTQQNGRQQQGRKSRGAQALREAQGPADGTKPTSRLLPDYPAFCASANAKF